MPTSVRPGHPFLAGSPLLFAHRGGAGIVPENTLAAFLDASERWEADAIELDVRATRDNVIVVIHDPTVDRTCDGTGAVAEMSFAEIGTLDAGHHFRDPQGHYSFRGRGVRVPRLEEVLEALPDMRINLEIKEARAARGALRIIREHRAEDRVLIGAIDEANRAPIDDYQGPWGASKESATPFLRLEKVGLARFARPRFDALQVPEVWNGRRVLTPSLIRAAHRKNIPVHVWTVDDPEDMVRMLEWGVDGIQSDRPDLLARVLVDRYGRPAPPGLLEASP